MKKFYFAIVSLALIALPLSASAAYEFYVTIEGAKQGRFKGECGGNWKDALGGLDYTYEVAAPYDASGRATGKRQHKPISITKEVGAASPQIFQAMLTNEVLKSVLISFLDTTPEGDVEVVYTIKLVNAGVSNIKTFIGTTPDGKRTRLLETFSLSFQRIDVESKIGKTAASDDASK